MACTHRTHQGRHPDGALEKRDVPERPHRFSRLIGIGAWTCQNQHRKVRPGRVRGQDRTQRGVVRRRRRFLGQQHRGGADSHFLEQRLKRPAHLDANAQRRQHRLRRRRVLGGGRQEEQSAVARRFADDHVPSLSRAGASADS